jgi:hypothetical protein
MPRCGIAPRNRQETAGRNDGRNAAGSGAFLPRRRARRQYIAPSKAAAFPTRIARFLALHAAQA